MTTVQAVLDEIREQPGAGDVIGVFDPSTEDRIAEFTDGGPDAVDAAVARAKAAAEVWCLVGPARLRASQGAVAGR